MAPAFVLRPSQTHRMQLVGIITRKDLANIRPEMTREEFTTEDPEVVGTERQPLLTPHTASA
jgi:hypothetical protein